MWDRRSDHLHDLDKTLPGLALRCLKKSRDEKMLEVKFVFGNSAYFQSHCHFKLKSDKKLKQHLLVLKNSFFFSRGG